ncbi:MAG: PorT family protein [Muribaculaceae bacterium]|nr:PorT family protein [Muribaculaceae bacterium]
MRFTSLKFCTIALCLISFVIPVRAQSDHYEGNIFLGGHAGMTISRTFFNPSVPQGMKLGAMAGFTFRYIEENHFGLIAELNFEQRGWKEDFKETDFRYSRTLNYLQIPILAHIYFGSPRAHFFVNAGPEIGFMVGDNTSANFDPTNINNISNFPLHGRQVAQLTAPCEPKVDFGISGGLGVEVFTNSSSSFTLEGRFYYGLGNTIKCGRAETFSSANAMSIMVKAGYWFRMK